MKSGRSCTEVRFYQGHERLETKVQRLGPARAFRNASRVHSPRRHPRFNFFSWAQGPHLCYGGTAFYCLAFPARLRFRREKLSLRLRSRPLGFSGEAPVLFDSSGGRFWVRTWVL